MTDITDSNSKLHGCCQKFMILLEVNIVKNCGGFGKKSAEMVKKHKKKSTKSKYWQNSCRGGGYKFKITAWR